MGGAFSRGASDSNLWDVKHIKEPTLFVKKVGDVFPNVKVNLKFTLTL